MVYAYVLYNTIIHTASAIGEIINASLPTTRLPPQLSSLSVLARLHELWIEVDVYASFIPMDRVGCVLNLTEFANLETLVICRAPQTHGDSTEDPHYSPMFPGYRQHRPTLVTSRDVLKPLEVSGPICSGSASCPCPRLITLKMDVVEPTLAIDNGNEAGYVHKLAALRPATGCPIFRLLIGLILRGNFPPKACVVSLYDAEGQLTGTGAHEADGLVEHWRKRTPV